MRKLRLGIEQAFAEAPRQVSGGAGILIQSRCYGLNVCVLQNPYVEALPSNGLVLGSAPLGGD